MRQVEKQRSELTCELDDLTDRLEEAGGAAASQWEAELQRPRRELEEAAQSEAAEDACQAGEAEPAAGGGRPAEGQGLQRLPAPEAPRHSVRHRFQE
ncbi:myosin-16-like [Arapaima gigas]